MGLYDDQSWPCAVRGEQEFTAEEPTCFGAGCRAEAVWQAPSGEWWCDDHAEEARGCWYCYRVVVGEHALPGKQARRLCEQCLEEAKAGDELRRRERDRDAAVDWYMDQQKYGER